MWSALCSCCAVAFLELAYIYPGRFTFFTLIVIMAVVPHAPGQVNPWTFAAGALAANQVFEFAQNAYSTASEAAGQVTRAYKRARTAYDRAQDTANRYFRYG